MLKFDLNNITRLHCRRCTRGTRVDHVTRIERDVTTDIAHQKGRIENQVSGPLRLLDLTIHPRLQQ